MQLAEKLNALNLDMEEEEKRKEIEQYRQQPSSAKEVREMKEIMRMKREAEERCLHATTEHLLAFTQDHPDATYHQWIEDLHPENAHDGTLYITRGVGQDD
jgi:hypothetical protein